MTTKKTKTMLRLLAALSLAGAAACGSGNKGNGGSDLAMSGGGADMGQPGCVMTPTTAVEILNACTSAESGDATKDAPYFPSLAPNGNLPPLP